jgi:phenylalanyl-tRNA synthetase beta chain
MLVSWNWLRDYVPLDVTPAEFADRLMMAGLNHESTEPYGADFVVDLEVTSNRPDCLGHLGIAREAALLFGRPLRIPQPEFSEQGDPASTAVRVDIEAPDLCPQYSARLIRGVRIGPSPAWIAVRLQALGIALINNVVDATNYVLMECGQPLHAFDYNALAGGRIVVRRARAGERLTAIDHKVYELDPAMCVIADAERPVALAGVMGGAESEVQPTTRDILIEAAEFSPMSVRATARKLKLHSPSSYRFERGIDAAGVDWASRRCCELILRSGGGQLAPGQVNAGLAPAPRPPVTLRLAQLPRILGIDVPVERVQEILAGLGCVEVQRGPGSISVAAPSWRRDLSREIDLVEEVARVHGYDKIPEDTRVPMVASHRGESDRVHAAVRATLAAAGLDEALTLSMVSERSAESFSPWTDTAPLVADTPILEGADRLRRSLIPSLLAARQSNESKQNSDAALFEIAKIYLRQPAGLPREQWTVGLVVGGDYFQAKGLVTALLRALHIASTPSEQTISVPLLDISRSIKLMLDAEPLAFVGELSALGLRQAGLRARASIAEINLDLLTRQARLIPQHTPLSNFPVVTRDLNLVVEESVRWADLATTVRSAVGPLLESLEFREVYRDPAKDGADRKRLLFTLTLRAADRTLTNEEADAVRVAVVSAAGNLHGARLLEG